MTGEQVLDLIRQRDDGEILSRVKRLARAHHVTAEELLGGGSKVGQIAARHELWAELVETGHWSSRRLGELFGVDSSTVRYGIIRHRNRLLREKVVGRSGMRCEQ